MKATCNREGLMTAFGIVASVVPARSPKPILQHVKMDLREQSAILSGTDLELGIRYQVSGVVTERPGETVLPASEMNDILREVRDEKIVLEATHSGVRITGATSRFELNAEDPLQYPDVPDFGEERGHRIKSGVLATMIRRTAFATASDGSRYALHSVCLELEEKLARLVATDGRRLAMMAGPVLLAGEAPGGFTLIRPKALSTLSRVLQDPDEEIEMLVRPNEILFRTAKATVYSRLAEGRFPKYAEVLPGAPRFTIPMTVGRLQSAVRQSKIVTDNESKAVDFQFNRGELVLRSRAADLGESEVRVPIGYDGDPIGITFDPQLLLDALKVLEPEDEIRVEMIDEAKAAVFRTRDDYLYLVMPLRRERPVVPVAEAEGAAV